MSNSKSTRSAALGACFLALAATAAPAFGQWGASAYGVAEYDTKETFLLFAGVSAGPGGLGWSPTVDLQAYRLTYGETEKTTVYMVKPGVGLRYGYAGGATGFTVGYAFLSKDEVAPPGVVVADAEDGVVLSGYVDHEGSGAWATQALASYNFGASSIWSRLRLLGRVSESADGGSFRLGGEMAFMNGSGFTAYQPGVVAQWRTGNGYSFGLGVGRTIIKDSDDATYFRVEFGLPLMR